MNDKYIRFGEECPPPEWVDKAFEESLEGEAEMKMINKMGILVFIFFFVCPMFSFFHNPLVLIIMFILLFFILASMGNKWMKMLRNMHSPKARYWQARVIQGESEDEPYVELEFDNGYTEKFPCSKNQYADPFNINEIVYVTASDDSKLVILRDPT